MTSGLPETPDPAKIQDVLTIGKSFPKEIHLHRYFFDSSFFY